jgi:SAM-dependent methyltransferase
VLASDGAQSAVLAARRRVGDRDNVEVVRRRLPDEWPDGTFDLLVCSEVLYYLDEAETERFLDQARRSLEPGGTLLAVHWRGRVPETGRDGDEVHAQLAATAGFTLRRTAVTEDYRCAVHDRVDPYGGAA